MISRPDAALTDFTSNVKGCNAMQCSSPENHMLDACIQNFFRVSTLYRVGGGRTATKFRKCCTVLRRNREITEKYDYCSSIPRTFVQDCLNPCFFFLFSVFKSVFFTFSTRFRHFGDKQMITCNNNDLRNYFLNIASFYKAIP